MTPAMTAIEALHTAARRYCMEEALLWHKGDRNLYLDGPGPADREA
jgi:hypothetical protein